jgi:hypothetical protein
MAFEQFSGITPTDGYPAAYVGIGWASNNEIRLERHVSPYVDWYDFYKFSERTGSVAFESKWLGETCVRANKDSRVACLRDGTVFVNGESVYSESPFDGITPLEVITATTGTTVQTQVAPPFRLLISSIDDGVTLTVTLPDGTWSTMRIDNNGFDSISYAGEDYSFLPQVIDVTQRTVQVSIVKGLSDFRLSALTWVPNDDGLILTRTRNGDVFFVLIRPDQSNGGTSWRLVSDLDSNYPSEITSLWFELPWLVEFSARDGFVPVR